MCEGVCGDVNNHVRCKKKRETPKEAFPPILLLLLIHQNNKKKRKENMLCIVWARKNVFIPHPTPTQHLYSVFFSLFTRRNKVLFNNKKKKSSRVVCNNCYNILVTGKLGGRFFFFFCRWKKNDHMSLTRKVLSLKIQIAWGKRRERQF